MTDTILLIAIIIIGVSSMLFGAEMLISELRTPRDPIRDMTFEEYNNALNKLIDENNSLRKQIKG